MDTGFFIFILLFNMAFKKRGIRFLWILLFSSGFSAVSAQTITFEDQLILEEEFNSEPFAQIVQRVGSKHGFSVFFADTTHARVKGDFRSARFGELLRTIASEESLRYFWFDNHTLVIFSAGRLEEQLQSNFIETLSRESGEKVEKQENDNVVYTLLNRDRKRTILLEGTVLNGGNSEPLFGSSIYFEELQKGVTTDFNGKFQLHIPPGVYNITVSGVGFENEQSRLFVPYDGRVEITLFEKSVQMKEAVVTASRSDQQVNNVASGQEKLDLRAIEKMPAFLGEVDVIRSITMLPGISTTGEGSAGFQVRGGSADQNLVLLDGVPIFQTSHLFGFFFCFPSRCSGACHSI